MRGIPPAPEPLPVPVVDNHLHLDIARHGEERADVGETIAAAAAVGVPRMVQIGCDLPGARETVAMIEEYAALLGGVSLHPNEIGRFPSSAALAEGLAEIEALAAHPRVRVVGETGLDYFRTGPDGRPGQQEAFRWHIDLAKRLGKTLQIHDREAHDDVLRILEEEGARDVGGVMHCFTESAQVAEAAMGLGFLISFSGIVTFRNAAALKEVARQVPLERMLVETDSPYLAPVPHRGRTNEPSFVRHVAEEIARLKDVPLEAVAEATTRNFFGLFRGARAAA